MYRRLFIGSGARFGALLRFSLLLAVLGASGCTEMDQGPEIITAEPPSSLSFLVGEWSVVGLRARADGAVDSLAGSSFVTASLGGRAIKEILTLGAPDGDLIVTESLVARRATTPRWAIARGEASEGTFDVLEGTFFAGAGTFVSRGGSRPDGGQTRVTYIEALEDQFSYTLEHRDPSGSWNTVWVYHYVRASPTEPTGTIVSACDADGYRDFDFWIGDWNAIGRSGSVVGTNDVKHRLDGCIVEENWVSSPSGTSFNMYDARSGLWQQMWTDASGVLLILQGERDGDQMVLTGDAGGARERITWTDLGDATVRQLGETEQADGSWVTAYDLTYSRD